jgi:hypothetical protein
MRKIMANSGLIGPVAVLLSRLINRRSGKDEQNDRKDPTIIEILAALDAKRHPGIRSGALNPTKSPSVKWLTARKIGDSCDEMSIFSFRYSSLEMERVPQSGRIKY